MHSSQSACLCPLGRRGSGRADAPCHPIRACPPAFAASGIVAATTCSARASPHRTLRSSRVLVLQPRRRRARSRRPRRRQVRAASSEPFCLSFLLAPFHRSLPKPPSRRCKGLHACTPARELLRALCPPPATPAPPAPLPVPVHPIHPIHEPLLPPALQPETRERLSAPGTPGPPAERQNEQKPLSSNCAPASHHPG